MGTVETELDHGRRRSIWPLILVPALLLVLAVAAFGLFVTRLGFYWDDLPAVWYYHILGSRGYTQVFAADRPLLGWLYTLTTPLLGESVLRWQVFGLVARWACSVTFFFSLLAVWPGKRWLATAAALLFLVYPGFTQQHIAITYSHVWLLYIAFTGSIGLMALGARGGRARWVFRATAWALAAYSLFSVEYFFGLELLRPLFLMVVFGELAPERNQRLRTVGREWLPYLIMLAGFVVWRVFLTETPRGEVTLFSVLAQNPLSGTLNLLRLIFGDVWEASVHAWGQLSLTTGWFEPLRDVPVSPAGMTAFAGGITAAALYLLLRSGRNGEAGDERSRRKPGKDAALIGLAGLVVGGLPFLSTDLPMRLDFPWDRFTLPMMLAAALFGAGLLTWLIPQRRAQWVILSLVVGLAVNLHFQNGDIYQRRWALLEDFMRQLTARVPALEPDTLLITDDWPYELFTDNSLAGLLNWVYAPEFNGESPDKPLPYMIYDYQARIGGTLAEIAPGVEINAPYRVTTFSGSTDRMVVFTFNPPACLHILDPEVDWDIYRYPLLTYQLLPYSRTDLILSQPENPAELPGNLFRGEVSRDWCYYYTRAELALQEKNYTSVAGLGDEAREANLEAFDLEENFPFIEGYARTGRLKEAGDLSNKSLRQNYRIRPALCALWSRILPVMGEDTRSDPAVSEALTRLNCPAP